MIGGIHAQNQAIAYPPRLHITRVIVIKIVLDKVCPCLPIKDVGKKNDFKI